VKVKFKALEVISETQDEMVISLKGRISAVFFSLRPKCYMIRNKYPLGPSSYLGQQVEDLFTVVPPKNKTEFYIN